MTTVARWLDDRRPAMPAGLRQAVDAALERSAGGASPAPQPDLPRVLAAAGLHALARAASAEPDRATAAELLAADALLTYACEAAAEDGPEAVDELTAELGFDRFESLLERAER